MYQLPKYIKTSIFVFSMSVLYISSTYTVQYKPTTLTTTIDTTDTFTEQNLIHYIKLKQLKHPHIVLAQAKLETGNFKSTVFKNNCNLFGMKYIHDFKQRKSRETTATGSKHSHAVYLHWKHSVDDYLLWQRMFTETPIQTEADYFKLLRKKYATDTQYVFILKQIIKYTK
jgi:flagellum-specific peptidoglycan hydrolase FlgJ